MLILTRRIGETVVIGDTVDLTIMGIRGSQVRLGVNAPKEVAVHREEIYQRIQEEKLHETEKASPEDLALPPKAGLGL